MLPDIWGKCAWNFLHLITLDYPNNPTEKDKQNYTIFFNSLQYVLPCEKCRHNMKNHLKKYPLTDNILSSREGLIKWCIDLHNIVNHYTGKPMLTYQQAIEKINELLYPQKPQYLTTSHYFIIVVSILILGFLVYYFCLRNKK